MNMRSWFEALLARRESEARSSSAQRRKSLSACAGNIEGLEARQLLTGSVGDIAPIIAAVVSSSGVDHGHSGVRPERQEVHLRRVASPGVDHGYIGGGALPGRPGSAQAGGDLALVASPADVTTGGGTSNSGTSLTGTSGTTYASGYSGPSNFASGTLVGFTNSFSGTSGTTSAGGSGGDGPAAAIGIHSGTAANSLGFVGLGAAPAGPASTPPQNAAFVAQAAPAGPASTPPQNATDPSQQQSYDQTKQIDQQGITQGLAGLRQDIIIFQNSVTSLKSYESAFATAAKKLQTDTATWENTYHFELKLKTQPPSPGQPTNSYMVADDLQTFLHEKAEILFPNDGSLTFGQRSDLVEKYTADGMSLATQIAADKTQVVYQKYMANTAWEAVSEADTQIGSDVQSTCYAMSNYLADVYYYTQTTTFTDATDVKTFNSLINQAAAWRKLALAQPPG